MTPRRRVEPPRKVPEVAIGLLTRRRTSPETSRASARPGQPGAHWSAESSSLFVTEPDRCLTCHLPFVPFGEAMAGRSPFWNGTVAGTNLGSSSARGNTSGGGPGVPRCHQAARQFRSRLRGRTTDKISGGSSFSPSEPPSTRGKLEGQKRGWGMGPRNHPTGKSFRGNRNGQPIVLHGSAKPGPGGRAQAGHHNSELPSKQ